MGFFKLCFKTFPVSKGVLQGGFLNFYIVLFDRRFQLDIDFPGSLPYHLFPHSALFGDEDNDITQYLCLTGQTVATPLLLQAEKLSFCGPHGRKVFPTRFDAVFFKEPLVNSYLALSTDGLLTTDTLNVHTQ